MECRGTESDHCCHIGGKVCEHLRERVAGRRWACGLYLRHGSWTGVHAAPEYQPIREALRKAGIGVDCGDWPPPGERCQTCGGMNG